MSVYPDERLPPQPRQQPLSGLDCFCCSDVSKERDRQIRSRGSSREPVEFEAKPPPADLWDAVISGSTLEGDKLERLSPPATPTRVTPRCGSGPEMPGRATPARDFADDVQLDAHAKWRYGRFADSPPSIGERRLREFGRQAPPSPKSDAPRSWTDQLSAAEPPPPPPPRKAAADDEGPRERSAEAEAAGDETPAEAAPPEAAPTEDEAAIPEEAAAPPLVMIAGDEDDGLAESAPPEDEAAPPPAPTPLDVAELALAPDGEPVEETAAAAPTTTAGDDDEAPAESAPPPEEDAPPAAAEQTHESHPLENDVCEPPAPVMTLDSYVDEGPFESSLPHRAAAARAEEDIARPSEEDADAVPGETRVARAMRRASSFFFGAPEAERRPAGPLEHRWRRAVEAGEEKEAARRASVRVSADVAANLVESRLRELEERLGAPPKAIRGMIDTGVAIADLVAALEARERELRAVGGRDPDLAKVERWLAALEEDRKRAGSVESDDAGPREAAAPGGGFAAAPMATMAGGDDDDDDLAEREAPDDDVGFAAAHGEALEARDLAHAKALAYKGDVPAAERDALVSRLKAEFAGLVDEDIATTIEMMEKARAEARLNKVQQNFDFSVFKDPTVRVVGVAGFQCPCGGTHVKSTGSLRDYTVVGIKVKKGVVRIKYDRANK